VLCDNVAERLRRHNTNLPLPPGFRRSNVAPISISPSTLPIFSRGLEVQHADFNVKVVTPVHVACAYLDPKITPLSGGGGNLKKDWLYYWHYIDHKRASSKIDVAISAVYSRCQIFRHPSSVARMTSVRTESCWKTHTMTEGTKHP
jgi:hypothetical protein